MKFAVALPHSGPLATAEAIRRTAIEAEKLGFESVWVHDHITYDKDWLEHRTSGIVQGEESEEPNFFESLMTLSYVAGFTKTIKLGTAILVLPLRDPRLLARQVLTMQALSHGRFLLGIGQGDYPADFRVMEIDYSNRVKLMEEYLSALIVLLRGGRVGYHGEKISFTDASFYPKVETIPIYMGGGIRISGESKHELFTPTLNRIARFCNGWIPEGPPEIVAEGIALIKQIADQNGRNSIHLDVRVATPLYVEEDKIAMERVGRGFKYELVGSISTVCTNIKAYKNAGATGLIMRCWSENMESLISQLRQFSVEVMPLFR